MYSLLVNYYNTFLNIIFDNDNETNTILITVIVYDT